MLFRPPQAREGDSYRFLTQGRDTRTPHVSCVLCIQYASLYEAVQQVCAVPRQNPDLRAYDHVELLTETDDVPVANASICPSFFL